MQQGSQTEEGLDEQEEADEEEDPVSSQGLLNRTRHH
jgi:hypothetical protein